jgi:hypothetical protein
VLHPLDEVPVAVVSCLICPAEDFDEIEVVCLDLRDCLRGLLAFRKGVASALQALPQTRKLKATSKLTFGNASSAGW